MNAPKIAELESQLPQRLKNWLSDAKANEESISDAADELIQALRHRFHWDHSRAVHMANDLLEAYGEDNFFVIRK